MRNNMQNQNAYLQFNCHVLTTIKVWLCSSAVIASDNILSLIITLILILTLFEAICINTVIYCRSVSLKIISGRYRHHQLLWISLGSQTLLSEPNSCHRDELSTLSFAVSAIPKYPQASTDHSYSYWLKHYFYSTTVKELPTFLGQLSAKMWLWISLG